MHNHIYCQYVGYNEEADTITAMCMCGDKTTFPARAGNRRVFHSAHGAGGVIAEVKDNRFVDPEWDKWVDADLEDKE